LDLPDEDVGRELLAVGKGGGGAACGPKGSFADLGIVVATRELDR